MRTTLVIDDEVFRQAKIAAANRGSTLASVVEDGLRLLLAQAPAAEPTERAPMPVSHDMRWVHAGIDIDDNSALLAALDQTADVNALR